MQCPHRLHSKAGSAEFDLKGFAEVYNRIQQSEVDGVVLVASGAFRDQY